MKNRATLVANPWPLYLGWVALCCLALWRPLTSLVKYCLQNDNASHIVLIPLIVAWLIWRERAHLSKICLFDLAPALFFALPALLMWALFSRGESPVTDIRLSVLTSSLILLWIAGFIFVFGRASAINAWFSLAFLGFAIPLPQMLLGRVIYVLQYFSAAITEWIFDCLRVPALREGFVFHLPRFSIEVARECSGIRSSVALIILAVLIAHFAYTRIWKQAVFLLAGLVMTVLKNGVRIATLTILAQYVDRGFLFGRLHNEGGVLFFLFGLALLLPLHLLLRRGEPRHTRTGIAQPQSNKLSNQLSVG